MQGTEGTASILCEHFNSIYLRCKKNVLFLSIRPYLMHKERAPISIEKEVDIEQESQNYTAFHIFLSWGL